MKSKQFYFCCIPSMGHTDSSYAVVLPLSQLTIPVWLEDIIFHEQDSWQGLLHNAVGRW